MVPGTPFHERINELNQTGIWSHWAGYLVAERYQLSEKFEYFAIRNSAGIFDTSPLYKYRIQGRDAERFLAGVLARDIRKCRPGRAQYTMWCDDAGYVIEDGVVFRLSDNEFFVTAAEPNLSYLQDLIGYAQVEIEDVSGQLGALALQGPRSRQILSQLTPDISDLGYFRHTSTKIGNTPVMVSRTGYTGDLGYEMWIPAADAVAVWDHVMEASAGHGVAPFGQVALLMTRIEAGLILIGADFQSSRYGWHEAEKVTPLELSYGWMFKDLASDDRAFIGRRAIERELADQTSRWKMVGVMIDWKDWDRVHNSRGLIAPKDHIPVPWETMLYDEDHAWAGFASSLMYSPMCQRYIGIARVLPHLAAQGTPLQMEVTLHHRYDTVAANVAPLPFFNPERKTA